MTQKKKQRAEVLETGLFQAMRAIDKQIAREMQRTPAERAEHGVQKWEPYTKRIEKITALVLEQVGSDGATLDSLFVLSQAFAKSLKLLVTDLGEEGLGTLRSDYCRSALNAIARDIEDATSELSARDYTQ